MEKSIVYWSNQVLSRECSEFGDLIDGDFYKELLLTLADDESSEAEWFPALNDNLESTLLILKSYYNDFPNIINDRRYRDILTSDELIPVDQLLNMTELVIGVLLK